MFVMSNARLPLVHITIKQRPSALSPVPTDLIVSGIPVRQSKVVVKAFKVKIRKDQVFLDVRPDDSCHLISIQLHYWVGHLNSLLC